VLLRFVRAKDEDVVQERCWQVTSGRWRQPCGEGGHRREARAEFVHVSWSLERSEGRVVVFESCEQLIVVGASALQHDLADLGTPCSSLLRLGFGGPRSSMRLAPQWEIDGCPVAVIGLGGWCFSRV
jgi:hypothetical protein